jgi:L,D-peptidoglycan transpeptidase YkuD (ErfK/YbiS/YcfS/YnhG family)
MLLATMIRVKPNDVLLWRGLEFRCAVGRSGFRRDKREGDGATPVGRFPLRQVLYRPDRIAPPRTGLPLRTIRCDDGWCDDPADRNYNRLVSLPYPASHERLWRADALYDLVVVIGYNDDPVVAGRGSAIFLHVATDDWAPTAGCVALALPDLVTVIAGCCVGATIVLQDQ